MTVEGGGGGGVLFDAASSVGREEEESAIVESATYSGPFVGRAAATGNLAPPLQIHSVSNPVATAT